MSRRKQSNPKPAVREEPDFAAVESDPLFASGRLHLRAFAGETLVLARKPLTEGSLLASYPARPTSGSGDSGKAAVTVERSNGAKSVQVMIEDGGHWIKLMRPALLPTDANVCLRFTGRDLVCTVTKDVNKEVELKVTCTISDDAEEKELETGDYSSCEKSDENRLIDCADEVKCEVEDMLDAEKENSDNSTQPEEILTMQQRRTTESETESDRSEAVRRVSPSFEAVETLPRAADNALVVFSCHLCPFASTHKQVVEAHTLTHKRPLSSVTRSINTNAESFCEACKIQFMSVDTYQAHRTLYCKTRHQDKNEDHKEPVSAKPDTVILRGAGGVQAKSAMIQPQAIYAAISTNPLILLPCSLVPGQGLVTRDDVSGQGIVLQAGIGCPTIVHKQVSHSDKDSSTPSRKTSHPAMIFSDDKPNNSIPMRKRKMSEGDVLQIKKTCPSDDNVTRTTTDQDLPLDLSLKKQFLASRMRARDVSASPPASRDSTTSPTGSFGSDGMVPRLNVGVERLSPVMQTDDKIPSALPPPKLIKQGNNICEECHIVFFKYDNYLAHKKNYCTFRRQQLLAAAAAAAATTNTGSEHSSDETSSDLEMAAEERRVDQGDHYRSVITKSTSSVFLCDACGVKFSTRDNLSAHQTYYCIKKADSVMSKMANRGDKSSLEPPFAGPEEWKCNYCDTSCGSYDTIRRHLLTHTELKGFRCVLCGYKGNTLRGMRSHACEHLSETNASIDEFIRSTVIAENGMTPFDDEETITSRNEVIKTPDDDISDKDTKIPIKVEDNVEDEIISPVQNGNVIHPSALCDVLIKMENDPSSGEESSSTSDPMRNRTNVESGRDFEPREKSIIIRNERAFELGRSFTEPESRRQRSLTDSESEIKRRLLDPDSGRPRSFTDSESERQRNVDSVRKRSLSESPPSYSMSVIRRTFQGRIKSDDETVEEKLEPVQPPKKRSRSQTKDLKYCKSCDISFYHLSNFLAHKKHYCISRVTHNCVQETTIVQ